MAPVARSIGVLLCGAALVSTTTAAPSARVIEVDVAVLGGGASGAHAAVRLRDDFGKSVVVVEKQGRLGGHVGTYIDPETGSPYNYGVNSYMAYGAAKDFFARFNVSLHTPGRVALNTTYADFSSGETLEGVNLADPADTTAALLRYLEVLEQYEDMILPSYEDFPRYHVHQDLVMPFRTFVKKYKLEAAVGRIFSVTGLGMGTMLDMPTLYVMQGFGAPIVRTFVGLAESFVPASGRNQELYDNIAAVLGNDVLYQSTVAEAVRQGDGATLRVKTIGSRPDTIIKAKRILVSFQPTLENFEGFDLDSDETDVFSRWKWSTVYVGIARNPALPERGSLTNTPTSAVPANWLEVPEEEYVGRFDWMGDENFRVLVTGNETTDTNRAQSLVQDTFDRLATAGTVTLPTNGTDASDVDLEAWSDHGPMHLHVSGSELASGFIGKKYALQGRRSTFYTGAAFSSQFTTVLWHFNDQYVLPKLVASLD